MADWAVDQVVDGDLDAIDRLAVGARKRPYPLAVGMTFAVVGTGARCRRGELSAA